MAAKFLPYLLAGISVGGQYALIAIGYTMVYGILRLINFAHGDIFTVAGFLMVYATASLPLTISIPLVVVATVLLGIAVEKIAYKPLRTAPRMSVMISAIGMSYLLQNSMWYVTGGLAKQYPALPWISDTVTVLGCQTKRVTVVTPFLVIVLVAALVTLIQKTKIGMAMRAASSALPLPAARPTPMCAMPAFFMMAVTSAKSRLMKPVSRMRSEMDCTA